MAILGYWHEAGQLDLLVIQPDLIMNNDLVLEKLHEARAELAEEQEIRGSRENSLTFTKIEEAILWRQRDNQVNRPAINGASE